MPVGLFMMATSDHVGIKEGDDDDDDDDNDNDNKEGKWCTNMLLNTLVKRENRLPILILALTFAYVHHRSNIIT
ncbi:unnamed protein product [Adineta ricciae]|uniref:Uncharacterized protein n=1 Tax=Adineta ricciae TaxID=249248 RepID=A0A814AQE7_ADIRI|nr:unnamed protein product [Adineta ricciae]